MSGKFLWQFWQQFLWQFRGHFWGTISWTIFESLVSGDFQDNVVSNFEDDISDNCKQFWGHFKDIFKDNFRDNIWGNFWDSFAHWEELLQSVSDFIFSKHYGYRSRGLRGVKRSEKLWEIQNYPLPGRPFTHHWVKSKTSCHF